MEKTLRSCADQIVEASIRAVLPDEAVRRALKDFHPEGRTVLVAAGKAAWQMAHAAVAVLGHVDGGVVVTKYNHVKGKIPGVTCCEAGHPVPDANSFASTQKALELVQGLQPDPNGNWHRGDGGHPLHKQESRSDYTDKEMEETSPKSRGKRNIHPHHPAEGREMDTLCGYQGYHIERTDR